MSGWKPQTQPAEQQADADESDERRERVGERGERLGGEHLLAVDRAREDRLERAVAVLGGHDVAGDERGDQREEPDRAEDQQRRAGSRGRTRARSARTGRRSGPPLRSAQRDDEDHRHEDRRQPKPEVGALLRAQLAQLPAVDATRRRPGARRTRAGRSATALIGRRRGRLGRRAGSAASPSVSRKNSSSSDAVRGHERRDADAGLGQRERQLGHGAPRRSPSNAQASPSAAASSAGRRRRRARPLRRAASSVVRSA